MADNDSAALLAIYGDPLVMKYTDEAPFPNQYVVRCMLKSVRHLLATGQSLEWAITLRDSDEVVGTCGLHSFGKQRCKAEVGCLLRQSAWGNGYMSEAIRLLMNFARDELGLAGLEADVAADNERARHLFKKLGYKQNRAGFLAIGLTV